MCSQGYVLLSRDAFREGVLQRDEHKCVICKMAAQDAHHIMERRLWPDEGYYLDNGASLCGEHHLEAEATILSCSEIREAAKVKLILPPHLYKDQEYDKWANPILPNGTRLRGELFDDASVQKALSPVLDLFTNRIKYPRTYHLPWSPGVSDDDRIMESLDGFENQEVVATIKMDGENTTLYNNYVHARSIEYHSHESRNWVKALHGRICYDIPEGWRVCGENTYAKHSIHYQNLESYFLVFSVWNEKNECLSWDDTVEWAKLLGLATVPVIWRGVWELDIVNKLYRPTNLGDSCEGYVVRVARSFHYREFRNVVGKYVREGHVQTQAFWMQRMMTPNKLAEGK